MFRTDKAHPWHGIEIGDGAPAEVTVFIEIVPSDTVKYEVDKDTGYLKIDRPQQYSNVVPANYGFIPHTYCAKHVADIARGKTDITITDGDHDPLDILVLSEHHIPRGDIILKARPIGGLCLVDAGEADDKIIAVLRAIRFLNSTPKLRSCRKEYWSVLPIIFLPTKASRVRGACANCPIRSVGKNRMA